MILAEEQQPRYQCMLSMDEDHLIEYLLHLICFKASHGQNTLKDISDMQPILPESVISKMQKWLITFEYSILETLKTPFRDAFPWGYVAQKGKSLFLYIHNWEKDYISLAGLNPEIRTIQSLSTPSKLRLDHRRVSMGNQNLDVIHLPKAHNLWPVEVVEMKLSLHPNSTSEVIQQSNNHIYMQFYNYSNKYLLGIFIHTTATFKLQAIISFLDTNINFFELEISARLFLDYDWVTTLYLEEITHLKDPLNPLGTTIKVDFGDYKQISEGNHALGIEFINCLLPKYRSLKLTLLPIQV